MRYRYVWNSDAFLYETGTSDRTRESIDELPYEAVAELSYSMTESGGFLKAETYPENNILRVKMKKPCPDFAPEMIPQLKGYKKFFGSKNIKAVCYG